MNQSPTYTSMLTMGMFVLLMASSLVASESRNGILLITDDSLTDAWQEFARWKTRSGKPCRIVSVQAIAQDYQGSDIQQKIRSCALEYISKHQIKWVILGGDSQVNGGLVPDRNTPHLLYGATMVPEIPTDVYYISPKNWDADGDGLYGEWYHDREAIAYGHADACIGRIPIRTVADVRAYTKKVKSYESRYPSGSFATSFCYNCAVPFADYKAEIYWDKRLAKNWQGGTCEKFFNGKTPRDQQAAGDFNVNEKNLSDIIDGGKSGKMHWHGHGLIDRWVLEGDELFTAKSIAALGNDGK